ncbi:protein HESO1 [Lactuca sativa]|uniref:Poly(A) RNA polymerase mitochondrial-like central palm domain-containing protein n=1 Tax=Lactuca sativa TaxID=4236 RepID=A0A9R1UTJ9_LACSA|nr:protein HESO1 [Lactuca sativa]KAJ0193535.1 hypothetical protein LSAT_V11C800394980 [Lactuca sativa]
MNSNYSLALTLTDILYVVNPTQDDWSKRFQIINDLRSVVETLEILRGATVEPFGSFVSNLFTRWGDLDVSIELPNGSYISSAGKKYKQTLLLDVLKALKRKGGFHGIKYISHARVPILKCDSNKDNISCDISINNLSGQMKSKMLFWINEIDGRFRDLVLIVKEWAKAHGINDPKTGTLNSYSLSLLIIFHFQTCEPAILPPLSEIYQGNMAADLFGVRAVAEKNIEDACSLSINRIKSDKSRRVNRSSLADLFLSFLEKFCDINVRASTQGISPYNGQWEDIDTNMIWQPKTYALFIEDPFEQPMNCARAVGHRNLMKIAQVFQSSYEKLTSPNLTHPLAVLVRPEVLSIMSRSQVPSFVGGINGMNLGPQFQRNPVGSSNVRGGGGGGAHLQLPYRNTGNNNNGGLQAHRGGGVYPRGARAPGQGLQQQPFMYQNMMNPRPLMGSQSQSQRNTNQRPTTGQSSSQSQQQVHQIWRPRSEK